MNEQRHKPVVADRVRSRAPGRVNLIGEHTDYNDGFVLPMALPFDTTIDFVRRSDGMVRLNSEGFEQVEFSLEDDPADAASWGKYIAGMVKLLEAEGVTTSGFDASVETTIPVGASLSSSAALEVAAGFGICALAGVTPDPVHIAKLGQRVENEIIGINSGIMDQLISAVAVDSSLAMIDCRSLDVTHAAVPDGASVVIMDTMTRRELVDSEYDLRRAACERAAEAMGLSALRNATSAQVETALSGVEQQRARHIVSENQRVLDVVAALGDGDLGAVGAAMNESHRSLSVDYEVSSDALDVMAAIAQAQPGCFGARMTGGGFAGSAVALIDSSVADAFAASVIAEWEDAFGERPDIWVVEPSAGASVSAFEE